MFHLSEFTAKPECSATYKRLILITYGITVTFILSSSFFLIIQLVFIVGLGFYCKNSIKHGKPHPEITQLSYSNNQWRLDMLNDILVYDTLQILIANTLFQLIKVSHSNKNELYIFFNDQFTSHQWRLIYLLSANTNKK